MFLKYFGYLFFIGTFISATTVFSQDQSSIVKKNPMQELIRPSYLKEGDSVALVAPSGIFNCPKSIPIVKNLLKSWGLKVKKGKHMYNHAYHFAGTDEERAQDLQEAFDNPNIKAVWCVRGGYGTVRVLDLIDYTKFKKNPKWVIGYSDITALHNQIHNLGVESLHAMMGCNMGTYLEGKELSIETFKKALFGESLSYTTKPSKYNREGTASGQIVGGNLTLLHTMLGSKTSLNTDGKILFIEEIGEYAYHIDRMLQSLKRAGYFNNCKGVIIGDITKVKRNSTPWGSSVKQLILDVFKDKDFPVLFNFPAGHKRDNRALLLGRTIDLKVEGNKGEVVFKG